MSALAAVGVPPRAVRPRGVRPQGGSRRARHARLAWFVRAARDGWWSVA